MPHSEETEIALLKQETAYIRRAVDDIKEMLKDDYVTRSEFNLVRNVVFGIVGLILTGVVSWAGGLLLSIKIK